MSFTDSNSVIPKKFASKPDLFFIKLDAAKYIESIREPKKGKLNPVDTARKIGIPLYYDLTELEGELSVVEGMTEGLGLEFGKKQIVIRIKPNSKDPLLTFAHEVGHYFLEIVSGYKHCYPDQAVEDFCEYFAYKLVETN